MTSSKYGEVPDNNGEVPDNNIPLNTLSIIYFWKPQTKSS